MFLLWLALEWMKESAGKCPMCGSNDTTKVQRGGYTYGECNNPLCGHTWLLD